MDKVTRRTHRISIPRSSAVASGDRYGLLKRRASVSITVLSKSAPNQKKCPEPR
jgi:hypothetical protein